MERCLLSCGRATHVAVETFEGALARFRAQVTVSHSLCLVGCYVGGRGRIKSVSVVLFFSVLKMRHHVR